MVDLEMMVMHQKMDMLLTPFVSPKADIVIAPSVLVVAVVDLTSNVSYHNN